MAKMTTDAFGLVAATNNKKREWNMFLLDSPVVCWSFLSEKEKFEKGSFFCGLHGKKMKKKIN